MSCFLFLILRGIVGLFLIPVIFSSEAGANTSFVDAAALGASLPDDYEGRLARSLSMLEEELASKQQQLAEKERTEGGKISRHTAMKNELRMLEMEAKRLAELLVAYGKTLHAILPPVRWEKNRPQITERLTALQKQSDGSPLVVDDLSIPELGVLCLEEAIGGRHMKGEAILDESVFDAGTFLSMGPCHFFISDRTGEAGVVQAEMSKGHPAVVTLKELVSGCLRDLSKKGSSMFPIDFSAGIRPPDPEGHLTFWAWCRKPGLWTIPMLLAALAGLALAIRKLKELKLLEMQLPTIRMVEDMAGNVRRGQKYSALKEADRLQGPFGRLLQEAVLHGDESASFLGELIRPHLPIIEQPLRQRFFWPFIIAALALATGITASILEIIRFLHFLALIGGGGPDSFSQGMKLSFIPLEMGLSLALPVFIFQQVLRQKLRKLLQRMELLISVFRGGVSVGEDVKNTEAAEGEEKEAVDVTQKSLFGE